jgi:DNA polymerase elongation subunit (family B)
VNLCSHGHEEVCFEARKCPVCELIAEHESKVEALEEKIAQLESHINDIQERNDQ